MADFIPEESIFKFKNAFAAFESKKTGLIKVKQLGGVMRLTTKFSLQKAFGGLLRLKSEMFQIPRTKPQ